ncbi:hypothetical protein DY000_02019189 [Brassica cretica]|uniref:Uncharacterized protein n=1 Tax=Brassica cretica TaxID=69181 RepID=A0ABQ7CX77_BRACR|nr:hypothetical protein DY000_02019189 [Brassica cretica]
MDNIQRNKYLKLHNPTGGTLTRSTTFGYVMLGVFKAPKTNDARLWCLRKRGRERPWCVAPTSRSGLRERPQWVALRGRSGLRFVSSRHGNASDLGASLWQVALRGVSHDRNASDLSTSLWLDRYGMCVTATSRRRSGEVALLRCLSVDRFKHFF